MFTTHVEWEKMKSGDLRERKKMNSDLKNRKMSFETFRNA